MIMVFDGGVLNSAGTDTLPFQSKDYKSIGIYRNASKGYGVVCGWDHS